MRVISKIADIWKYKINDLISSKINGKSHSSSLSWGVSNDVLRKFNNKQEKKYKTV